MSGLRLIGLIAWVMMAFAGNSLLCRSALLSTSIDPGVFSLLRLASGAAALSLFCFLRFKKVSLEGSWLAAALLAIYVLCFSYAYCTLSAGIGALLLFGAVQLLMILSGMAGDRERVRCRQYIGGLGASIGLVILLWPTITMPSGYGALLMLLSGCAWGGYSLLGKKIDRPLEATAGNFVRGSLLAIPLVVFLSGKGAWNMSGSGAGYAVVSGVFTSGVGYVVWYVVLPYLSATSAALVQLTVPVLAAFGGIILLGEVMTVRLLVSSLMILGGVALATLYKR